MASIPFRKAYSLGVAQAFQDAGLSKTALSINPRLLSTGIGAAAGAGLGAANDVDNRWRGALIGGVGGGALGYGYGASHTAANPLGHTSTPVRPRGNTIPTAAPTSNIPHSPIPSPTTQHPTPTPYPTNGPEINITDTLNPVADPKTKSPNVYTQGRDIAENHPEMIDTPRNLDLADRLKFRQYYGGNEKFSPLDPTASQSLLHHLNKIDPSELQNFHSIVGKQIGEGSLQRSSNLASFHLKDYPQLANRVISPLGEYDAKAHGAIASMMHAAKQKGVPITPQMMDAMAKHPYYNQLMNNQPLQRVALPPALPSQPTPSGVPHSPVLSQARNEMVTNNGKPPISNRITASGDQIQS